MSIEQANLVSKAVVLAGGLGIRLRPVLGSVPKALAPVTGRPFIDYQLALLRKSGVTEVVLCLGYGSEAIQNYCRDGSRWGLTILYSVEERPLGTAGAIAGAMTLLPDETFFVLNGDTYFNFDYQHLMAFHRQKRALVTLALAKVTDTSKFGVVRLGPGDRIEAFLEKEPMGRGMEQSLINGGVYIFHRAVLEHIPSVRPVSLERDVFPRLVAQGYAIYGYVGEGYFMDIGTPQAYRQFQRDVQEGLVSDH